MEKRLRVRIRIAVALAILVIMPLFHIYNVYIEKIGSQTEILLVAIVIAILGAATIYVLRVMKTITDERSEFISSATGKYSFTANMCLMITFMFYEIFVGITLDVSQFIAFATLSIAIVYAALYMSVESYF